MFKAYVVYGLHFHIHVKDKATQVWRKQLALEHSASSVPTLRSRSNVKRLAFSQWSKGKVILKTKVEKRDAHKY